MPRLPRVITPGAAYHVTHRGNRRGDVFITAQDRTTYLSLLRSYAAKYELEVWAYCLMTNHVHLIVRALREASLAKAIGCTHVRYAFALNRRMGWSGHLWANRYYSSLLDGEYLWHAVRYVEINPVRAGLAERPTDYPWSSARANSCNCRDPLLTPGRPFPGPIADWSSWLEEGLDTAVAETIRANTSCGRPSGSPPFVADLESALGRTLSRPKIGRPMVEK